MRPDHHYWPNVLVLLIGMGAIVGSLRPSLTLRPKFYMQVRSKQARISALHKWSRRPLEEKRSKLAARHF